MKVLRVTVLGSSRPLPGDPAYEDAYRLGRLLGAQGFTVLTGGYLGTMEAVSRGTNEAGGHVIGVTCEEIERWRPVRANAWVQEEWRKPNMKERVFSLIENCDAAIVLPGGPGTLGELAVMWNLLIIAAIPRRPLILVGPAWHTVIETFCRSFGTYIQPVQQQFLRFSETVEEAAAKVRPGKEGTRIK
ncbi:MAG: LOG family protein [Chloroflexota bacterium]